MAGKQRKARRGKGSNKKGGDVTASSSSVPPATLASRRVDALKAKIVQLRAHDAEIIERIERDYREQSEVRAALAEVEAELEVEVLRPVANGVDPTESLPEELLMAILIHVVTAGVCGLVCRRWYNACQDGRVQRRAWEGRWEGYSAGWRAPQKLVGHNGNVRALAVGPDGTVYSGSRDDTMVCAWSGTDGTLLRTLEGLASVTDNLAVGPDGTVYAAGFDGSIRMWSGIERSLRVLEGHPGERMYSLLAAEDTLFSGATDATIRVWVDGEHVRTLTGHTSHVGALAIGTNDKLYSGSSDTTVRVWSIADGAHLYTLRGQSQYISSLVVGLDGTVYSGSADKTIRAWSGEDGTLLRALRLHSHTDSLGALAISADGTLWSGSNDQTVRLWCGVTSALKYTLPAMNSPIEALVIGADGKLYTGASRDGAISVW